MICQRYVVALFLLLLAIGRPPYYHARSRRYIDPLCVASKPPQMVKFSSHFLLLVHPAEVKSCCYRRFLLTIGTLTVQERRKKQRHDMTPEKNGRRVADTGWETVEYRRRRIDDPRSSVSLSFTIFFSPGTPENVDRPGMVVAFRCFFLFHFCFCLFFLNLAPRLW